MHTVLACDRAGVYHLTRNYDIWPLCAFDYAQRRGGWEPGDIMLVLSVWDRDLPENQPLTCLFCAGGRHAK
jgi:hypothetical protein